MKSFPMPFNDYCRVKGGMLRCIPQLLWVSIFVRYFSNAFGLKCMSLPFEMNIHNDLLGNLMDLDDDILYNFTDSTFQLMRDDDVTPWKGPQEKHLLSFQVLIDVLSKLVKMISDFFTL